MREICDVYEFIAKDVVKALQYYAKNPVDFCLDILRVEPQEWQREWMQAVSNARFGVANDGDVVKTRFAIRSGTGVGKTMGVACMILWHLAVFKDSKVVCTAPTSPQIKAVLWPEIRKWVSNIPNELKDVFPYDITTDAVKMYDTSFAVARTAQKERPEAFQGFHNTNVMLIADEASGVPDEIFNAGDGIMSEEGALLVMIGNPTRPHGRFYDAFHSDADMFWARRVSCLDSERVTPKYAEDKKRKFGEDSYEYQVRVLGNFYYDDDAVIISRSDLERAINNNGAIPDTDYIVWGIDVSDGGKDSCAIAKRQGNVLLEKVKEYKGITSDIFKDKIVDEFIRACRENKSPDEIIVDATGVGTAVFRYLKRDIGDKVRVTAFHAAGKVTDDRYMNARVEMWGRGREWSKSSFASMPVDEQLTRELSSVEWELNEMTGKYRIADKRVDGKSPNLADAFLVSFASSKAYRSSLLTNTSSRGIMKINTIVKAEGSASWL